MATFGVPVPGRVGSQLHCSPTAYGAKFSLASFQSLVAMLIAAPGGDRPTPLRRTPAGDRGDTVATGERYIVKPRFRLFTHAVLACFIA